MKKQYLKSKKICRVAFKLPKKGVLFSDKVNLVGDFNNWNHQATQMKKSKDGHFTATLDLESGKEYQFRYIIGDSRWENDKNADKFVNNPFGSMNSVVVL